MEEASNGNILSAVDDIFMKTVPMLVILFWLQDEKSGSLLLQKIENSI